MERIHGSARIFDKETAKELGLAEDEFLEGIQINVKARCPVCGAKLIHKSGCLTCYSCGWNTCK